MAMRFAGHGDDAQPSSVIPERPTAPDGGLSLLLARLDRLDANRTKGPFCITRTDDHRAFIGANPELFDPPRNGGIYIAHTLGPDCKDNAAFFVALENLVTELGWPTIRSALAASAPSVGEKELENCVDLSGTNQQPSRSSTHARDWRKAIFTYDAEAAAEDFGHLYYFAPPTRAPGPYLQQRHVKAIVDVASDGTFAGVELIDNMPPLTKLVEETAPVSLSGTNQQEPRSSTESDHARPHPRWKQNDGSDRHPQTAQEWDYRLDGFGDVVKARAERRLNVAMDYDDPRAPDQMAVVLRCDLSEVLHELIHKRAFFEMKTSAACPPGWRSDMENAPRDGTPIQIKYLSDDPKDVRWSQSRRGEGWHWVHAIAPMIIDLDPTHWRFPHGEKDLRTTGDIT